MPNHSGSWITTYTGAKFDFLASIEEQAGSIHMADIAHHLSLVNRFGGASKFAYSSASHGLLVAAICEKIGVEPLFGLIHDASDYVMGDIPTPLKHRPEMYWFRLRESQVQAAICRAFDLPDPREWHTAVKIADNLALVTEARSLLPCGTVDDWRPELRDLEPVCCTFRPADPSRMETLYLDAWEDLSSRYYSNVAYVLTNVVES